MRVAFLTGIWPPDIGGPASHGPDFSRYLIRHGHSVHVVTMGEAEPTDTPCPIDLVDRGRPFPLRYSEVAIRGTRRARRADLIYATSTTAAAAAAATMARRPLVIKLVSDPAYDRALRYGLFGGTVEDFQHAAGRRIDLLKRLRSATLRRARAIVVPSEYLARFARGWGLSETIQVICNPAPEIDSADRVSLPPRTLVFVGRLVRQKRLDVALDALARLDGATLIVVGDGPERPALERQSASLGLGDRVSFLGSRPRADVLRTLGGAHAAVLSSESENLPHAAVEALALGVPVVATAVGGVPEVVHGGENGILVDPGSVDQLADALGRIVSDEGLRARLAAAAAPSVAHLAQDVIYGKLENVLLAAAGRD